MNITKYVEEYIINHNNIKECISYDLINFSKLSRQICKDLNIKQFDAVLVACRRYKNKIPKIKENKDVNLKNINSMIPEMNLVITKKGIEIKRKNTIKDRILLMNKKDIKKKLAI